MDPTDGLVWRHKSLIDTPLMVALPQAAVRYQRPPPLSLYLSLRGSSKVNYRITAYDDRSPPLLPSLEGRPSHAIYVGGFSNTEYPLLMKLDRKAK